MTDDDIYLTVTAILIAVGLLAGAWLGMTA